VRIALIVDSFPVLSETFVINHAIGLLERGHDVRIFARCRPRGEIAHHDVPRHGLLSRTRYLDRPLPAGSLSGRLAAVVRANFFAPLSALKWFEKFRQGAVSLERLNLALTFLRGDFDIIHCHFGPNGYLGIFLKDEVSRAPVLTTFHGYDLSLLIASSGREIYKDLFLKGDLFLPVSRYFKKRLIELGCDERKVVVCNNGVNARRYKYIPRALHPGEAVQVLTVGRLVEKKGHEFLLRALARTVSSGRDVRLRIAGDGPLREKLESLARELGVAERVRFLGAVAHDAMPGMLQQSHIFALPSVTAGNGDQEGMPVSIMEAQASGLPVLSTCHSGIPELIEDGTSGYLVAERDTAALADRMMYLVDHPELWPLMGAAGRRIVEEKYGLDAMIEKLLGLYRNLVAQRA
jgi:colanic acid/amylovoran biosynthesis glycosyltransferase